MVQNQCQKAFMPLDDTIKYQYGDSNKNYMSWYQTQLVWVQHLSPRSDIILTESHISISQPYNRTHWQSKLKHPRDALLKDLASGRSGSLAWNIHQPHLSWQYGFVNKRTNTHSLTRNEATAIVKDTGSVTTHPFQSSLVNIGEQATLTDSGISHTIDQIVSVEFASYMMVPSATNTTRYHGLSQFIQMNNQCSQQKMEIFQSEK